MPVLSLRSPLPSRLVAHPVLSAAARVVEAVPATRQVSSQVLLDGARELVIQHQGSEYHLRLTRNDKLILTK
jgi:hemin uptake protein HemP